MSLLNIALLDNSHCYPPGSVHDRSRHKGPSEALTENKPIYCLTVFSDVVFSLNRLCSDNLEICCWGDGIEDSGASRPSGHTGIPGMYRNFHRAADTQGPQGLFPDEGDLCLCDFI